MNTRREARLRALQALYAVEISENSIDDVLSDPIWQKLFDRNGKMRGFYEKLIKTTVDKRAELDILIMNKSENWDFSRITIIDKLIVI